MATIQETLLSTLILDSFKNELLRWKKARVFLSALADSKLAPISYGRPREIRATERHRQSGVKVIF